MNRRTLLAAASFLVGAFAGGCGSPDSRDPVRLATTTSARDTGLLDVLLPAFSKETGIDVQAIAVGTGEALKYGERGDADVVLVHAREAEDGFLAKGFGVERRDVWWNRFLLVGPDFDVATNVPTFLVHVDGRPDETAPARKMLHWIRAQARAFVSRGDDSGTHKREISLWGKDFARWPQYFEAGQGMGPTLTMADEKNAYTLTDEGTWLAMRHRLRLTVLVKNDPALVNPYGAILVKPERAPRGPHADARRFFEWLTGPRAKEIVQGFRIAGRRPFFLPGEESESEDLRAVLGGAKDD